MSINSLVNNPTIMAEIAAALPTPTPVSQAGLLKRYFNSNANQFASQSNNKLTLWSNGFSNLDTAKQYIVHMSASVYVPSDGGVAGNLTVQLNTLSTVLQSLVIAASNTNDHFGFALNFNAINFQSPAEVLQITITADTGAVNFDTSDYICVDITEVQN